MFGLLLFLVCLAIALLLTKFIVELVVDPPAQAKAVKIAVLVVVLSAFLWLAGFGGWGSVYGWRMHP
jgi:hypothetical protein